MENQEPDYDLFEHLGEYLKKETLIDSKEESEKENFCNNEENSALKSNQAVQLCKKFVKYFEILNSAYDDAENSPTFKKYPEYLNYWLNHKLRSISLPEDDTPKFYQNIQENYKECQTKGKLNDKIYQIKKINFNRMNVLYELYKIYYQLKNNSNLECHNYHEKCKENYNLALNKCYSDDEKICNSLKRFTIFYNAIRSSKLSFCSKEGLPILPKFELPKSSDRINFTNKIAYRLIKKSKSFSEDGLLNISDSNYPKLKQLLSLNYNMLLENNDDINKCNIMEILYEFIKYCNENRNIPSLNSFIKEFFQDFYNGIKGEYEIIYEECSTKTSEKSYCSKYNELDKQLNVDLYSIKDTIQTQLENKTKSSQHLDSQGLSDGASLYVRGEDNILSNITPIMVGVVVGILFFLFLLYKFTPIGSWLHRTFLRKEDIMYNYDEENIQNLLENNPYYDNYNSQNGKIHLPYNAS
ncbi:PIR Superfamily Protein [Plasmodium ovale curtisi]|uniref:PIR Superfamily Protein n=1 Tax=Plasmodium ovale curtisi TaxID=864141 RepID=A0A1A8X6B1_PLAOA|nr:PIR Superfamily Protein [Plasmodium ovale curtisi]